MKTVNKTSRQIITAALKKYKNVLEDPDLYQVYSKDISAKKINNARVSHGIGIKEEIFLLIDYTLFGGAANSLLITEKGISIVIDEDDEDSPRYFIDWGKLIKVEYINEIFLFVIDEDNDSCNIELSKDKLGMLTTKDINIATCLTNFFTEIASQIEDEVVVQFNSVIDLFNEANEKSGNDIGKYEDFFKQTQQFIEKYGEDVYSIEIMRCRAIAYRNSQKYDQALKEINYCFEAALKLGIDYNDINYMYFATRSRIYECLENFFGAIMDTARVLEIVEKRDEKESNQQRILDIYQRFKSEFLSYPYAKRKFVITTDSFLLLANDTLNILLQRDLPDIKFPIGHPTENSIYVAHPYRNQIYIPLENYEISLFLDRVDEYCYLLQCLGAKQISIEWKNGRHVDIYKKEKSDIHADLEANYLLSVDSSTDIKSRNKSTTIETNENRITKNQIFSPNKSPYLPDKLIWYPHEISWQRLYEQRISGNLIKYSEDISSKTNKIVSSNELNQIKASLEIFVGKGKIDIKNELESQLKEETTTDWIINVEFAPISELVRLDQPKHVQTELNIPGTEISNVELPENEKKYLEEIKFALEDDGMINEDERRIIDRKRTKYEISEQRAKELEDLAINIDQFTKDEKEYLEEVKIIVLQDGLINDGSKRVLARLRSKLKISEERANEIENLVSGNYKTNYSISELKYIDELKFCLEDDGEISASERRLLEKERNKLNISEERAIEIEKEIKKKI